MAKRYRAFAALAVLFVLVLTFLVLRPQTRTMLKFHLGRDALEETAQRRLDGEAVGPPAEWKSVYLWGDGVEFEAGSFGIAPAGLYCGVTYTPDDRPMGFQGMDMTGAGHEDNVWTWQEENGDNRCRVVRLEPCWFYYEMSF